MDPRDLLRTSLLGLSRANAVRDVIERAPVSRAVVKRFVPGTTSDDALRATGALQAVGRMVTIDYLGEDTTTREQADATRDAYLGLLAALAERHYSLAGKAEVSLKLTALGLLLPDGHRIALDHARAISQAATNAGTTVTVDMEDHTTTDATLAAVQELREDFPTTGAVLQAYLRRTEGDCRDLAYAGSRVRLCKGAYAEPESVAYASKKDVDLAYVRCARTLMAGAGYPMLATHDPRLIDIGNALAVQNKRQQGTYEFQMLYGIRPEEQRRLASDGETMRVYVPYGTDWYGYFMRRLAERPANVSFFLRSLLTKS